MIGRISQTRWDMHPHRLVTMLTGHVHVEGATPTWRGPRPVLPPGSVPSPLAGTHRPFRRPQELTQKGPVLQSPV